MRKSRSRRRGYICIWGTTNRETVTDHEGVVIDCPGCGHKSRMVGKAATPYCSVFYVPLFREGKGAPFLQCTQCGGKYTGDVAAIRAEQQRIKTQVEAAIAEKMQLYHANPQDADLACEIVELLAQSKRVDEALKLASYLADTHPENANVYVVLGRIRLHCNELPQALEAFQQAIRRNPGHAGAHFFSAVALMNADPPRLDEALALAIKARDYGHPEARNLVQAIEQAKRG